MHHKLVSNKFMLGTISTSSLLRHDMCVENSFDQKPQNFTKYTLLLAFELSHFTRNHTTGGILKYETCKFLSVTSTRMHSSRMRTARSLTIKGGQCLPRGVSAWGAGGGLPCNLSIMHLMLPVCCLHTN